MRLTAAARLKTIDELYEVSKNVILTDGVEAFDWHSFGARVIRRSQLTAAGRKAKRCRWERIPGRALDPFSAYLILYFPWDPGPDSYLADLAGIFNVTKCYLLGMLHGTAHPRHPCQTLDLERMAGIQDGQTLYGRVEAFIELGRNGR